MIIYKQWYSSRSNSASGGLNVRHLQYIATRPGAEPNHGQEFGLWGRLPGEPDIAEQRDLAQAKEAVRAASRDRTVYRAVISAKKEDAENYGLYHRERWEEMTRDHVPRIAEEMGIRPENFCWVASFHKEVGHPHVHLLFWDSGKGVQPEGLSPERMAILSEHMRSEFGRDVYREDLNRELNDRQELTKQMRTELQALCREANPEKSLNIVRQLHRPGTERMAEELLDIARAVPADGSLRYAYLPPEVKRLVDGFTDHCLSAVPELEKMAEAYKNASLQIASLHGNGDEAAEHHLIKAMGELRKELGNEVMNAVREILAAEGSRSSGQAAPKLREAEVASQPEARSEMPEPDEPPEPPAPQQWGGVDRYGRKGQDNWWSKSYKAAQALMYGTKTAEPDLPLAFQAMEAEAKAGNGLAMHDLAKMYLSELGCEKDEAAAQSWFANAMTAFAGREATDERKDYWQYRIGKMYNMGYGVDQDHARAAEWYGKAASAGNTYAAYSLASLYYRGQGVEQDFNEAFRLYYRAAAETSRPNAYAAYSLAGMYREGKGTEADKSEADSWYAVAYQGFRAMERDTPDDKLRYRLGRIELDGIGTEVNYAAAEAHLRKAAELGNDFARYGLARLYLDHAFEGYSPTEAVKHLIPAAEQGNPNAQYLLGKLLIQGDEIPADRKAGEEYLLKAIAQGSDPAAVTLAKAHLPDGVLSPDIPQAVQLLDGAYKNGNLAAAYLLGKTLSTEESVLDIPKAIACLTDAAKGGNDFAEYRLGLLYFFGKEKALERDKDKGLDYLRSAAAHGNEYAKNTLENISKTQTVHMLCRMMHFCSQLASHRSAQASMGKAYSRDKSREARRDERQQQSQTGNWDQEM